VPVVLAGAHGYGTAHRRNLNRLTAAGLVRVVGVCDPAPLTAADLDALGGPEQSGDLAALIARTGPAVTIVSTPIHTHVDLALTAVRAGSHVLLEKPPAASLAGFTRLTDALRESGVVCQVGFQSFGSRAVETVRELVADGAVGPLRGIGAVGAWVRDARYYARTPWAGRRRLPLPPASTDGTAETGGPDGPGGVDVVDGVLTNPLAHALATALRIDGSDRAEDVASVELELFRAHDIEADDTSCVRLGTARGTTLTLAATLCAERNAPPYVVVHGEQGRITLQYTTDRLLLVRSGRPQQEQLHPRTDLLENLLAYLHDGTPLLSPLARAGAFTRVVEAVRTAPDPVRLPPDAWHSDHRGAAARRVIPGIRTLLDASAARLALFSELGAPWAAR
jgi:predicted dehydrogenase